MDELRADKRFVSALDQTNSLEEIGELMHERGLAMPDLGTLLDSAIASNGEELDEAALDQVAGGMSLLSWVKSLLSGSRF